MKIQAISFKIIEEGKETRVQLLDKNNNPVNGKNSVLGRKSLVKQ